MSMASSRRQAVLVLLSLLSAVMVAGSDCTFGIPFGPPPVVVQEPPIVVVEPPGPIVVVAGTFGIDLVNETSFAVDPGVSVDEFLLDLGTLAPLEGTDLPLPFDVDCLPGDTLTIDPVLFLSPIDQALAANGPVVLLEGVDYLCGDVISLFFTQDVTGTFFVDVAVNGIFLGI